MKDEIIKRFTSYVKVDTQSNEENDTCPSTPGQLILVNMLVEEMKSIGMQEVTIDENGYVMATLPANTEKVVPTIGFLSHVDTATDFTGKNVNPQIVENYDGNEIILNEALHVVLSPKNFPQLANYKGHTLITTDGTTLLGADNKAGVAEIMTAMAYLVQHPEIKHGKIEWLLPPMRKSAGARINLTLPPSMPNMPIQSMVDRLVNSNTKALMLLQQKLPLKATNIHPGTAKGKMVNSAKIAMEFNSMLPAEEAPEIQKDMKAFIIFYRSMETSKKQNYIILFVILIRKNSMTEKLTLIKLLMS